MEKTDARYAADLTRVLAQWDDPHPAWVWADDGKRLLWCNRASLAFKPKLRRKTGAELVPMGRQIARTLRLGTPGRASLSRMQFTLGRKPVSATCLCTPLMFGDRAALLVVGVDPVDDAALADAGDFVSPLDDIIPAGADWVLRDGHGAVIAASADGLAALAAAADDAIAEIPAGADRQLLMIGAAEAAEAAAPVSAPGPADVSPAPDSGELPEAGPAGAGEGASQSTDETRDLTGLLDRLAGDAELYAPLEGDDAQFEAPPPETPQDRPAAGGAEPKETVLWRVTARHLTRDAETGPSVASGDEEEAEEGPAKRSDAETLARTSRYNFDELSRILTDRIGGEHEDAPRPPARPAPDSGGALVSLGDETLLLNRLPLGLMVFRDQQVLFANRAFADLTDYPDTTTLRQAGLGAIFPGMGDEAVGPVGQLLTRAGKLVPVSARLQSVGWKGRPALLLSARRKQDNEGREAAVRAFAQDIAAALGAGFFECSRAGIVSAVSGQAAKILGRALEHLIGRPVHGLVALEASRQLRGFLEAPARAQGVDRPLVQLASVVPGYQVLLFAEQASGMVTGFFGLIRPAVMRGMAAPQPVSEAEGVDSEVLARVSRDIRDPLNSIVGFSDLLERLRPGVPEEAKSTYARDIRSAGADITGVLDELDEFARLKNRDFAPDRSDFDLGDLLDHAVARVRVYASRARVLVRSSIPLGLPRISADQASLNQAVLNLVASAIDQTRAGGQVVISARRRSDGAVEVHVRNSARHGEREMEKRFVMFREGPGPGGETLKPIRSSIGLPLTRSLLAVNTCSLTIDPTPGMGTLMSVLIPADLVVRGAG